MAKRPRYIDKVKPRTAHSPTLWCTCEYSKPVKVANRNNYDQWFCATCKLLTWPHKR